MTDHLAQFGELLTFLGEGIFKLFVGQVVLLKFT